MWQDVRLAMRMLRRSPGFAVVVVLTLGLGIGANAAIFGVINSLLLRPLPVADPHRLYTHLGRLGARPAPSPAASAGTSRCGSGCSRTSRSSTAPSPG